MLAHTVNLIVAVVAICCTFLIIVAFLVRCRANQLQQSVMSPRSPTEQCIDWYSVLRHVTTVCILTFLIHSCGSWMNRIDLFPDTQVFCTWFERYIAPFVIHFAKNYFIVRIPFVSCSTNRMSVTLYHTARCTMYCILVMRIHLGFQNTMYSYSPKLVIYPLFTIIIWWYLMVVFDTFIGVLYTKLSPIYGFYNMEHETCLVIVHKWAAALACSYDIIISTILLVLFPRPLVLLNHEMKREYQYDFVSTRHLNVIDEEIEGNHSESEISDVAAASKVSHIQSTQMTGHYERLDTVYQELIIRYAVLVILCIGSSLLMYLIMISIGHYMPYLLSIFVCMDDELNVWCIILINKQQNVLYHRLCCPCNTLMRRCCDGLDRRRIRREK